MNNLNDYPDHVLRTHLMKIKYGGRDTKVARKPQLSTSNLLEGVFFSDGTRPPDRMQQFKLSSANTPLPSNSDTMAIKNAAVPQKQVLPCNNTQQGLPWVAICQGKTAEFEFAGEY